MQMYTKSGRSLWPALVAALVALVLALVVLLVVVLRGDGQGELGATATETVHEGQPGEDHGPELGEAPTGCLAGTGRGADMLLATQAKAPHSVYGAIEMASSYMRWTIGYPLPDAAAIEAVQKNVVAADGDSTVGDLASDFAAEEANGTMAVTDRPFGTPFQGSTRNGQWLVDPESTEDRVIVHLSMGVVVDGVLSDEAYAMGSPVFAWTDGIGWQLVDMVPTDQDALEVGGTDFTGGC